MTETRITVGLNDQYTKKQKFEESKYISILKRICYIYKLPFSLRIENGGYFHENGEYTEENSLVLTLVDADTGVAEDIARDLCAFFNQESVMMTRSQVETVFIQEKLTLNETDGDL
ncbi:MAG: hypothetical protein IKR93_07045 [Firmicutes bacterium]|nr:hypothetical protein [Bacillota bacterium]